MTTVPPVPTLDDVARAAGVSTATVSRCLNSADMVSKSTRDKVMAAVDTLGYTPNFGARAMAARRTHTIGAIIPTMENAIFARGLQAFQETLLASGYNLMVSSSAYRPDLEAEQIKALVARGADGLLLIGYERDADVYDFLDRRGIPTLLAWAYQPDIPRPSVGFDNRGAMRALTQHIIDLGHRRIAVISGIVTGNDRAADRLAGVKDAVDAAGLPVADMPIIETSYDIEKGATAFDDLMARPTRPTVVICGNDVLAAGALSKAHEMGIRVPQDVSVTGFDDIELARIVTPALTTVHVPHRTMGKTAARTLIDMIENKTAAEPLELHSHVENRASLQILKPSDQ